MYNAPLSSIPYQTKKQKAKSKLSYPSYPKVNHKEKENQRTRKQVKNSQKHRLSISKNHEKIIYNKGK
jgi:hypothetical protein